MNHELVLIMDFGGQYNQLIARKVRECGVFCEVIPYKTPIEEIQKKNPKGIIFTGGPSSVMKIDAPSVNEELFLLGIPILGICYGMQLMAKVFGGEIQKADLREYGKANVTYDVETDLFHEMDQKSACWMSHTYYVKTPPKGFFISAKTESCPVAAMVNPQRALYGVQFHPEVEHTDRGIEILANFLFRVCRLKGDWKMDQFTSESIKTIQAQVGNKKALCALSGGVDSSVAAVLMHKAIGDNLTCIFVDHGFLRKEEALEVQKVFQETYQMKLIMIDAKERFLHKLRGITEPEKKRKIIGEEFIRVFEEEAKKMGKVDYLVQGTIYPDVIESGNGDSAVIKSHHNVGGLPESVDFEEILEPLRDLFKDEVRVVGRELEIPEKIVSRQPFPGPGLAIRIIGDITQEKLDLLKEADFIFRNEIAKANLEHILSQYFAVLTNMKSVGVMGDERSYDFTLALRAVTTTDFMTADWAKIPYEVLEKASSRIVNEVGKINRIVYDITSKPPSTIEWE